MRIVVNYWPYSQDCIGCAYGHLVLNKDSAYICDKEINIECIGDDLSERMDEVAVTMSIPPNIIERESFYKCREREEG